MLEACPGCDAPQGAVRLTVRCGDNMQESNFHGGLGKMRSMGTSKDQEQFKPRRSQLVIVNIDSLHMERSGEIDVLRRCRVTLYSGASSAQGGGGGGTPGNAQRGGEYAGEIVALRSRRRHPEGEDGLWHYSVSARRARGADFILLAVTILLAAEWG